MESFFFFSSRRRHTRLQGDWSSDVCSSDLAFPRARDAGHAGERAQRDLHGDVLEIVLRRPDQHERSEEHTSELQSPCNLVCRLLLEKKKTSTLSHFSRCNSAVFHRIILRWR